MSDSEHPFDQDTPEQTSPQEANYQRIRDQLHRNRARQYGLGGVFLLMTLVAGGVAWVRQTGERAVGGLIPLLVLLGMAISFTGIVMLLESPRQALKGNRRLSRTFLWYGLAALLLGLPGGIGLSAVLVFIARA